jgi:hypothetical protein
MRWGTPSQTAAGASRAISPSPATANATTGFRRDAFAQFTLGDDMQNSG